MNNKIISKVFAELFPKSDPPEALKKIFFPFLFSLYLFLSSTFLSASQYTITGSVTDADRQELEEILEGAEHSFLAKFRMDSNFQLTFYVCVDLQEFLRLTGVSQWNGGFFVRDTVYLQRLPVLRERGILEQTVVHEFLHYCVRSVAGGECPIWLNEGLVLNLSGEAQEMGCLGQEVGEGVDFAELDKNLRAKEQAVVRGAYCLAAGVVEKLLRGIGWEELLGVLGRLKGGDGDGLKEILGGGFNHEKGNRK